MLDLDTIEKFSTIIVALVNVILVYFVFSQIRDSRKPFVTTGLISTDKIRKIFESSSNDHYVFKVTEEKNFWDDVNVFESGYLSFFIRNDSKNVVSKLDLTFKFKIGKDTVEYKEKRLSHLNPKELTYLSLKTDQLVKKFSDLFTEHEVFDYVGEGPENEKSFSIKYPRENLSIEMTVLISYNPVIGDLFPIIIEDNYTLQWATFDDEELSSFNASDFVISKPRIICWNVRQSVYYIHKMQIRDVV